MATRRKHPARRRPSLGGGRKRVLVVLFVPSVERDGATPIDQNYWVDAVGDEYFAIRDFSEE
jgi:hypothetical protein